MHLPEFYGMASNGSIDQSSKHKPDLSYGPNNELVELVWENGHVLFQGQSSRGRKNIPNPNPNPNSSNIGPSKMGGKFGFLDDFQTAVPSVAETDEEDMVPWLNYPMDELLPEISGVTANELELHQNSFVSVNKSNGKSFDSCNQPPPRDSFRHQDSVGGLSNGNTKIQNNFGFFNFSHFARPGTLGRANMENVVEESGGKGKESLMDNDNLATTRELMVSRGQTNLIEDHHVVKRSEAVLQEEMAKNDRYPVREIEKTVEPIVAASSVCSVSSAERASNNSMPNLKRKRHETDESEEGRSDDVEEESVGVRKGASARGGCMGSKRSRAAEVHNLSERRRRDRINEKMRALQELIPNCNKVDKASMLDEAIEYLKTLQLQVQIMSMGAGLYMPQMMMQPFHPSHFSPMGIGFGMGMMDLNGGPPRNYPLQQQHHPNFMQGPAHHFPFARPSNGFQMFGQPSQGQHPAMSGPSPPPLVLPTVAGPISSTQLMVSPDVSNSPSPNQVSIAKNGANVSEQPGLAHKKDPAAVVGLRSRDHQHAE